MFFNFSLKAKIGEFSEKDSDYANDMVAFLAAELRDGPPAKRTPQTDPTLTEAGPKITWVRALSGHGKGMSPLGDRYWVKEPIDAGGERLLSIGFESVDDRIELLRVAHRLGEVRCGGDMCLAADSRPSDPSSPNTYTFDDPTFVHLVDTKRRTSIELHGEGDHPTVPREAAAPDGTLFVVGWYRKTGLVAPHEVLYLYGPDGKARGPIDLGKESVNVLSVTKTRILVEVGDRYGKDKKLSYVGIDPASLAVSPAVAPPDALDRSNDAPVRSPDKKRTAQCRREGAEIVIRDVATGAERVLAVHEDDRVAINDGCVRWASSRFLEYRAAVIGWLDADTMKIALGLGQADAGMVEYDKDFKWAVDSTDGKLRLGKIDHSPE